MSFFFTVIGNYCILYCIMLNNIVRLGILSRPKFTCNSLLQRCSIWHPEPNSKNKIRHLHTTTRSCDERADIYPDLPVDYGKYYQPGNFESVYQWFVDSSLVHYMEKYFVFAHDLTGLPWWMTIIACTVVLRAAVTTPLLLWQTQKTIKHKMLIPTLMKLTQRLRAEAEIEAKKQNWNEKTKHLHLYNSYYQHEKKLLKDNKIPGTFRRYLLPWVQIPLWMSVTASLRHLTLTLPFIAAGSFTLQQANIALSLSQQGVLWFPNLCLSDPYYILPFILSFCNLAIIEVHRGDGKTPLVGVEKFLINLVRGISVILIPIACYMPSGVVLYWVTSSGFGLAQALALQSARVKRICGFPVTQDSKTPYKDIVSRFLPKN